MTAQGEARRLLAGMVDEAAVESEPIAEVRADLAALGVDPAPAIMLARRMAASRSAPAADLLGRIAAAEALDQDIRRLEQADIADIRGQIPEGEAATAAARAHRAAGGDSNIVGLRRRRSRRFLYGLGGMVAAMAASVVLYVGMSPPDRIVVPEQEQVAKTAVQESDDIQARMAPAAEAPQPIPLPLTLPEPAPESKSIDATTMAAADSEAVGQSEPPALTPPTQSFGGVSDASESPAETTILGGSEESLPDEVRGDLSANRIAEPFGLDRPVVALLVVDPKLVPTGLQRQVFPAADLARRLDDARRLAAGRPIAALVTLQLAEGRRDAVILADSPTGRSLTLQESSTAEGEPARVVATAEGYDVLLLDNR